MQTQRALMDKAFCAIAEANETFLAMVSAPHPLTATELRGLITRRPEFWGRFERWLNVLPE